MSHLYLNWGYADSNSHMTSVSFSSSEPRRLWRAQTAATRMTTTFPWIPAPLRWAPPRLTIPMTSTFLWPLDHTLISQDSLPRYLPARAAAPHCVTGPLVSAMSRLRLSTATWNLTGNVSCFFFPCVLFMFDFYFSLWVKTTCIESLLTFKALRNQLKLETNTHTHVMPLV